MTAGCDCIRQIHSTMYHRHQQLQQQQQQQQLQQQTGLTAVQTTRHDKTPVE